MAAQAFRASRRASALGFAFFTSRYLLWSAVSLPSLKLRTRQVSLAMV
jgi:hypothetical protein